MTKLYCTCCKWECHFTDRVKAQWNAEFHEKEVRCGPTIMIEVSQWLP